MTVLDYIILGLLACSAIAGLVRGFLREICSLLTWVLAVWVAWKYGHLVEPYLSGTLRDPLVRAWAARVPLFLGVLLAGAAIGALLNYVARLSLFSGMDRLLGLLLGVVRGLVILGIGAMICHAVRVDGESWWRTSRLVPYVESVANVLRSVVGEAWVRERGPVTDI